MSLKCPINGVLLPSLAKKEQDQRSELCSLYGHGLSQSLTVGVSLLWGWISMRTVVALPKIATHQLFHTPGRALVEITDQISLVSPLAGLGEAGPLT